MSKKGKSEEHRHIKDMVLEEYGRGNIVFASVCGLHKCSLEDFVKQPLEGMLYDINRDKATITTFLDDPKWINDLALTELLRYYYNRCNKSLWHEGSEKPQTGRIMFESTEGGLRFADYDFDSDRFDSDDECYYSGTWEDCHIKRWMYEKDLLEL